jgi:hypothetical protein
MEKIGGVRVEPRCNAAGRLNVVFQIDHDRMGFVATNEMRFGEEL